MADKAELPDLDGNDALQAELGALSTTQRAAVLMLLLGEEQAASIIRYMDPKEVQALGGDMAEGVLLRFVEMRAQYLEHTMES